MAAAADRQRHRHRRRRRRATPSPPPPSPPPSLPPSPPPPCRYQPASPPSPDTLLPPPSSGLAVADRNHRHQNFLTKDHNIHVSCGSCTATATVGQHGGGRATTDGDAARAESCLSACSPDATKRPNVMMYSEHARPCCACRWYHHVSKWRRAADYDQRALTETCVPPTYDGRHHGENQRASTS